MNLASGSYIPIRLFLLLAATPIGLLSMGCSSPDIGLFKQAPPEISGVIVATESLNPRRDGLSTSVILRVYQLKTITAFTDEDFFALYENGEAILGPEALVKEMIVLPGSTTILDTTELAEGTTHVGVLAAFRDWENADWQAVLETPADKMTVMSIRLEGSDLSLTKSKRKLIRKARKAEKNKQEN